MRIKPFLMRRSLDPLTIEKKKKGKGKGFT